MRIKTESQKMTMGTSDHIFALLWQIDKKSGYGQGRMKPRQKENNHTMYDIERLKA
jgi:hypothetical protein